GLAVRSGNNQDTPILTPFASPLLVSVTSSFGDPVAGGMVTFTGPESGASASFSSAAATISATGLASTMVTANGKAGSYIVTAAAAGASAVTFSLTNDKGTPILTWTNPAAIS